MKVNANWISWIYSVYAYACPETESPEAGSEEDVRGMEALKPCIEEAVFFNLKMLSYKCLSAFQGTGNDQNTRVTVTVNGEKKWDQEQLNVSRCWKNKCTGRSSEMVMTLQIFKNAREETNRNPGPL